MLPNCGFLLFNSNVFHGESLIGLFFTANIMGNAYVFFAARMRLDESYAYDA